MYSGEILKLSMRKKYKTHPMEGWVLALSVD
jgi:hypothetical protein